MICKKVPVLVLSLTVLVLISCNKEEVSMASVDSLKSTMVNKNTITFSQFGASHNAKLDYVAVNTSNLSESTLTQRLESANDYNDPTFGLLNDLTVTQSNDGLNYVADIVDDMTNAGTTLNDDYYVADGFEAYYNDLGQLLQDALDSLSNSTDYTPETFATNVNSIINDIELNQSVSLDTSTMTGTEAAKAIITMEIAKASYTYWYSVAEEVSANEWKNYLDVNGKSQASFWSRAWRGIKRAAVDVFSFPSCPHCGGYDRNGNYEGPYNLGDAWDYAGDQSSAVD